MISAAVACAVYLLSSLFLRCEALVRAGDLFQGRIVQLIEHILTEPVAAIAPEPAHRVILAVEPDTFRGP